MKTQQIENELNEISLDLFGRSRSLAIAGANCVSCGKRADTFRDELSKREFGISGFCQACQDSVFGVEEE